MARPNKQGLDYFPLDVDFLENEKMLAISGEFAVKGEIIVLRLLCEIYRNGYFVEYSGLLKNKLARLGGLSGGLVDEVVKKLVEYNFFNGEIFCEYNVLTSKSIQQRYLEAVKRRKDIDISRYWVLKKVNDNSNDTPKRVNVNINDDSKNINADIKPQSKGNRNKRKGEKSKEKVLTMPFSEKRFLDAWGDLLEMPKWKKKPNTSIQKTLERLSKYHVDFAIELINRAIEGNYQGLIFSNTDGDYQKWLKTRNNSSNQKNNKRANDIWSQ